MTISVFIDGEAGTTGLQIRERLAARDDVRLIQLDDTRRKDAGARAEALNDADAAILCLPDGPARDAVAMVRNERTVVIDASTAHRTADGWVYGFPEMTAGQLERIAASRRIAVPGCYPTGTIALVRPLVECGLLPADWPVTVNAVSGYSGGGKAMIEAMEAGAGDPTASPDPIRSNFFLYGLGLEHKHVPEMHRHTLLSHPPMFVPSVGRFRQGMLVSIPLALWALPTRPGVDATEAAIARHFADAGLVHVVTGTDAPARLDPEIHNDTTEMTLRVFGHAAKGEALLTAAYDNLGKGASGAAVQCLEIALNLEQRETGLTRAA